MKKTKIIALVLCASIMLMGAGYAYWSDTLTINNTVATGELNVRFTDATLTTGETGTQYLQFGDGVNTNAIVTDKNLNLKVGNLYPGASYKLNANFENNGTIPAVAYGMIVSDDTTNAPAGKTQITLANADAFKVTGVIKHDKFVGTDETYDVNTTLKDLGSVLNGLNLRLEPQDKVSFENVTITLDPNAGDSYENSYVGLKLTINFKQHNQ